MKRLTLISVLLFVAPLAFGACRHDPTAPEGDAFNQSQPRGDIQVSLVAVGGPETGMAVTLDGGPPQNIVPGQGHIFSGVSIGEHWVRLGNVDKRCLAEGGASRRVMVHDGQTESVYFFVRCEPQKPWKPQN